MAKLLPVHHLPHPRDLGPQQRPSHGGLSERVLSRDRPELRFLQAVETLEDIPNYFGCTGVDHVDGTDQNNR